MAKLTISALKTKIDNNIKSNDARSITGPLLNEILDDMIDSIQGVEIVDDVTNLAAADQSKLTLVKDSLRGGLFYFDESETAAEDGGVIFEPDAGNGRWKRIYDKSKGVEVDWFGAVGDGTTDDTDAIKLAVAAAGVGGVVVFSPGKTFLISDEIRFAEQTWIGYGATIKRCDLISTTLAAPAASGTTTITVVDASVFSVGDDVIIVDSTSPNGGEAYDEHSQINVTITNIAGNTITLDQGIDLPPNGNLNGSGEYASGEVIFKAFNMVKQFSTSEGFKCYGLSFDGNRANQTISYSWLHSYTIYGTGHGSIIADCIFKEIANENMNIGNGTIIRDNKAYNLNGSFTHISESGVTYPGQNIIKGNVLNHVCEKLWNINGHNEGAFTFSSQTFRTIIDGNQVINCGEAFMGYISGNGDGEMTVSNNKAVDCNGVTHLFSFGDLHEQITISNNQFHNCLWLSGDNNSSQIDSTGLGFYSIIISNNHFINVKFFFEDTSHLLIDGNNIIWENGYTYPANTKFLENATNHIQFRRCLYYTVSNNTFEDQSVIQDSIENCIYWTNASVLKTDASTGTNFEYFNRYSSIHNNRILGYSRAIYYTQAPGRSTSAVVGFQISNNIVVMRDDADAGDGIIAYPGMIVIGNIIYGDANTDSAIYVRCAYDTVKAVINGPIISNNKVYGNVTRSIEVGEGTSPQESIDRSWNAVVINNVVSKAVYCPNAAQNTLEGNVVLDVVESIPLDLVRENQNYY